MWEKLWLALFESIGIMLFVFFLLLGAPALAAIPLYLLEVESLTLFVTLWLGFLFLGFWLWRVLHTRRSLSREG